jgi:hypothetical protein
LHGATLRLGGNVNFLGQVICVETRSLHVELRDSRLLAVADLAPASHQLYVGGFRVNNQIDVRWAGDPREARLCSSVDLSIDPLRHAHPTPPE